MSRSHPANIKQRKHSRVTVQEPGGLDNTVDMLNFAVYRFVRRNLVDFVYTFVQVTYCVREHPLL